MFTGISIFQHSLFIASTLKMLYHLPYSISENAVTCFLIIKCTQKSIQLIALDFEVKLTKLINLPRRPKDFAYQCIVNKCNEVVVLSYNENTRLNVSYLPWHFIQVHTSSVITSHCVKSWPRARHLLRLRYLRDCSSPERDGCLYNCMQYGSSSHFNSYAAALMLLVLSPQVGVHVNTEPCWSDMTWRSKFILSLSGTHTTRYNIRNKY